MENSLYFILFDMALIMFFSTVDKNFDKFSKKTNKEGLKKIGKYIKTLPKLKVMK